MTHHQREDTQVAVAVIVPVVVAVETSLVEVAEIEPVAVRVEGQHNMSTASHITTHRILSGLYSFLRQKRTRDGHGV